MLKRGLKWACYSVALAMVAPWAAAERWARNMRGRDVWFQSHGEALSLMPGRIGWLLRNAYYHLTMRRCPMGCCLSFGTVFTHSATEIGERVYTGAGCIIGTATIGEDTMLADHVYVLSGRHQHAISDPSIPFQSQPQTFTRIHIGRNCWIGTNTVVMADIGDNCVVGAGSVVAKTVPDNSVAVGNPARVIRTTFSSADLQKAKAVELQRATSA